MKSISLKSKSYRHLAAIQNENFQLFKRLQNSKPFSYAKDLINDHDTRQKNYFLLRAKKPIVLDHSPTRQSQIDNVSKSWTTSDFITPLESKRNFDSKRNSSLFSVYKSQNMPSAEQRTLDTQILVKKIL